MEGLAQDVPDETPEDRRKSIRYDEWDYRRGGYRRRWCSLFEHDIHPSSDPFVDMTIQRYSGYLSILRKRFELLKREQKMLRRQKEGDHIDFDAVIEAFSDLYAGQSPKENLFMRLDRHERNIAVLFLLDMSGSTKGWVNQAEKESLVLMSEALEALEDRYAIYGFSGMTRMNCAFYRIKGFDESYTDAVRKRIAGIEPKDYTRMGPPIRHSTSIINAIEARTKLLITLSDGKPEDWDGYKGEYGIEDTRKALIEARDRGIHSFCITIDKEASTYLPYMYGESNYIVIDDVRKLPNRITEIYRRLTA
jgi:nitric oxide reductase NorD protein